MRSPPACAAGGCAACTTACTSSGPLETPHARGDGGGPRHRRDARSSLPSRRSLGLAPTARRPDARDARGRSRPGIVGAPSHPRTRATSPAATASPSPPPPRTLLDLAATEPTAELERALNEAGLQRRVSPHSLNEQFSRYPHHRGTAALKKAIDHRAPSHPLRPRAHRPRPDPPRPPARARDERPRRRPRSRPPLARPRPHSRDRQLGLPLNAQFVRAGPPPGPTTHNRRLPSDPYHRPSADQEPELVVATLTRALALLR